ncbi:SCO family protein [Solemya velesiana gill symbiont]|uniref:SCO family protein n=1 Tax=Solemya velesiana gill symbiont TaxID=1918948 RepID=A0A1T2KXS1_9GAMM|nr:SCO family protein [Solemya velesiana gill symbiont]OOZ37648.1 SCO family protein [Solemya velesiana gill symbiont]
MKKPLLLLLIALLAAALVWVVFFWSPETPEPAVGSEQPKGGDFVFQSNAGPVALKDLRGKAVVLYFGYTWCPDICPTSLGFLAAALNELNEEQLADVEAVFVSVDPDRDTLDKLKTYAGYFHHKITGATGARTQIDQAVKQYGAAYRLVEQDSATQYLVDHSADLYLIDKQGQLANTLRHGTQPQEILDAILQLLGE